MARRPLDESLQDPGYTPAARDVPELVARLLAAPDDDAAKPVARALGRAGLAAAAELGLRGVGAGDRGGPRAARLLGRLAPASEAEAALVTLFEGGSPKTIRAAARALGAFPSAEPRLVAAWDAATEPDLKRALALALRQGTSASAEARLAPAGASDDPLLATLARRGALAVERTRRRGEAEAAPAPARDGLVPDGVVVRLRTKRGFASFAADEAAVLGRSFVEDRDLVVVRGPLRLGDALDLHTVVDVGLVLPEREGANVVAAVVDVLVAAAPLLQALTTGAPTVRVAFLAGGHRRSELWGVAEGLAARDVGVRSDPRGAAWEARVLERAPEREGEGGVRVEVELVARRPDDPRWPWREADVPAASHPTVAAALARVAGVRPDDVVWDPFCGSGAELFERARLGPYARLVGTDHDVRALEAARANVARSGLEVELACADARVHVLAPAAPTLVLTNPPLGRRVARGTARPLLELFLAHVGQVLAPGGRLVWVSPDGPGLGAFAEEVGLVLESRTPVDLGGVPGDLERWVKPLAPRAPSGGRGPRGSAGGRRRAVPRSGRE